MIFEEEKTVRSENVPNWGLKKYKKVEFRIFFRAIVLEVKGSYLQTFNMNFKGPCDLKNFA